ncbi:hypothetical protein J4219_00050 [Candidatus Woesearchaeota archaeon]|nr:hypothetical protein [Candidatus Woesearchaeota archaeon]
MKPYIGITGFKTAQEVQAMNLAFERTEEINYTAMYGFISSTKRMKKPEEQGNESPALAELEHILRCVPANALHALHYFTEEAQNVAREVTDITTRYDPESRLKAVQLNLTWPSPKQVELIRAHGLEVILQLPRSATEGKTPSEIATKAKEYNGLANYILVDPSGGLGIEFEPKRAAEIMHAVASEIPAIVGAAGGLSAENVFDRVITMRDLYENTPHTATRLTNGFCIDAQGKLRNKKETVNEIDIEKAQKYVCNAVNAFKASL